MISRKIVLDRMDVSLSWEPHPAGSTETTDIPLPSAEEEKHNTELPDF